MDFKVLGRFEVRSPSGFVAFPIDKTFTARSEDHAVALVESVADYLDRKFRSNPTYHFEIYLYHVIDHRLWLVGCLIPECVGDDESDAASRKTSYLFPGAGFTRIPVVNL